MYVDIKNEEDRKKFLYFLEGKGYVSFHFTRENIIKSNLPFDINLNTKKFTRVGNITCAAATADSSQLISMDEAIKIINSKSE